MRVTIASAVLIFLFSASSAHCHAGPFDGKDFRGRIAFSHDGNFNDEDDWGAFPVAVAILDAFGATGKLVHVDYSNILTGNDPRFYRETEESVSGSAQRYGIPRSVLFDCQKDLKGAIESIKNAINASSADDPLYYILAGPMEVPYLGIEKSDPEKRKYVYCISHSRWNDGYAGSDQALHKHNKRDVIPSGINWIQIKDGNPNLAHPGGAGKSSTPEQWRLYQWLRDSSDPKLQWIFTRLQAEGRADISDATMTYFLLTGDEDADLGKLKSLLDDKKVPAPTDPRRQIRIEAENFKTLDNYVVDPRNDRGASHRLSVGLAKAGAAAIRTPFNQPYAADGALYDVDVRYFDQKNRQCRFTLYVNGKPQGSPWNPSQDSDQWKTHTIADVTVATGDEIKVEVQADGGQAGKLDYVQLNYKKAEPKASPVGPVRQVGRV